MYKINTKVIRCPQCKKGRIVDVPKEAHKESIICILPGQIGQADFYVKCPKCGSQIGISFLHN